MFKLGEYDEDEAKSIADYLKGAGFKVDLRGVIRARTDFTHSLYGRMSEMKGKLENIERFERFLGALRAAAEKTSEQETFLDLYLTELDPEWKKKRDEFDSHNEPSEESEEEIRAELVISMAENLVALDFAKNVLEINEITPGEPLGNRLDDPLVSIPVPRDNFDLDEDPMLRKRLDIDLVKMHEVFIDELHAPLFREIDEEFQEEYQDEYLQIVALGLLIDDLVENPEKGKLDMEDFMERCIIDVGEEEDLMTIDASDVAQDIARILEKNGVLKMKGNTIKWKA
ncbi:Uncharacterised protein [uncultured archaeon]|nr:Uncharacterised protein [uncultured archaeon]